MMDPSTVLVVEDETDLADLYASWLDVDYDVLVANTAEDALDILDDAVDVVLLDRRLPDLSGDAFLDALRERGCDCQVAIVSAVDPDWDILEMRFDAYLVKPVARDDLLALVSRLLTRRRYDDEVQQFFELASKRATLDATKDSRELETSERYRALVADVDALRADLGELVGELSDDDFAAVLKELQGPVDADD